MKLRDEISKKWAIINNKLINNKDRDYYNNLILEAKNLIEESVDAVVNADSGEKLSFSEKLVILKNQENSITDDDIKILKDIQYLKSDNDCFNRTSESIHMLGIFLSKLKKIAINEVSRNINDYESTDELLSDRIKIRVDLSGLTEKEIKEARDKLRKIKFTGLPKIYDLVKEDDGEFIELENLSGTTLKAFKIIKGEIPITKVINIGENLCMIIDYLHSMNIMDNKILPSNILIDSKNNVSLRQYGIPGVYYVSELSEERLPFVAPEVISSMKINEQSEVYSIGSILYYIIEGKSIEKSSEINFIKCKDKDLINIIKKALAIDVNKRYASVGLLLRDLNELEDKKLLIAKKNLDRISITKSMSTKQKLSVALIGGIVAVIVGLFGAYACYKYDLFDNLSISSSNDRSYDVSDEVKNKYGNKENTTNQEWKKVSSEGDDINMDVDDGYVGNSGKCEDDNFDDNHENYEPKSYESGIGYAFDGNLKIKINSYEIVENEVRMNAIIESNCDNDVQVLIDGIFLENENKEKFTINKEKQISEKMGDINLAKGENKKTTLYFTGYKKCDTLEINFNEILSSSLGDKERIKIRIK